MHYQERMATKCIYLLPRLGFATLVSVGCSSGSSEVPVAGGGGGGGGTSASGGSGGTGSAVGTPASHWTLTGTVTFPASESASNLALIATVDPLSYRATNYASDPVPLSLAGSPPTASFTMSIDTTRVTTSLVQPILHIIVFQDKNANQTWEFGEKSRSTVPATVTSSLWCDGTGCANSTDFLYIPAGVSETSDKGTITINVAGWYSFTGCSDYICAKLITEANSTLTDGQLVYSYYDNSPIVPSQP